MAKRALIYVITAVFAVTFAAPAEKSFGSPVILGCGWVMIHDPAHLQLESGRIDWWQNLPNREGGWNFRNLAFGFDPGVIDPLETIVPVAPHALYVHFERPADIFISKTSSGGNRILTVSKKVKIFREGSGQAVWTDELKTTDLETYFGKDGTPRPPPASDVYAREMATAVYLSTYNGSYSSQLVAMVESVSILLPAYRETWALTFEHRATNYGGFSDVARGIYRYFNADKDAVPVERAEAYWAPAERFMKMRGLKLNSFDHYRDLGFQVAEEGAYGLFGTLAEQSRAKDTMMIDARIDFFEDLIKANPKRMILAHIASSGRQRLFGQWGLKPVEAFYFFDKDKMTWKPGDAPIGRPMTLSELDAWDKKPESLKTPEEKKAQVERIIALDIVEYLRRLKEVRDHR